MSDEPGVSQNGSGIFLYIPSFGNYMAETFLPPSQSVPTRIEMNTKIVVFLVFVAFAQAEPQFYGGIGGIGYGGAAIAHAPYAVAHAPVAVAHAPIGIARAEEYDSHPRYSFEYNVQDATTGDFKSQHEERDGDVVRGHYSLVEPDGTRRIVEYTADSVNGFNAAVHKEGTAHHAPVAVHHPLTVAQPVIPHGPFGFA